MNNSCVRVHTNVQKFPNMRTYPDHYYCHNCEGHFELKHEPKGCPDCVVPIVKINIEHLGNTRKYADNYMCWECKEYFEHKTDPKVCPFCLSIFDEVVADQPVGTITKE